MLPMNIKHSQGLATVGPDYAECVAHKESDIGLEPSFPNNRAIHIAYVVKYDTVNPTDVRIQQWKASCSALK